MDESNDNLQCLKNLLYVELFQLTEDELKRFLLHLKETTLHWRGNGIVDWGIEGLVIRGEMLNHSIHNRLSVFHRSDESSL